MAKVTKPNPRYDERVRQILEALKISGDVARESKEYTKEQKKVLLAGLAMHRDLLINPKPQFRSMKSLAYIEDAVIGPFNESDGPDTEKFWERVIKAGLGFKRRDVIREILDRKRIKDRIEYDLVIDLLPPLQLDGKITPAEARTLQKLADQFSER